MSGGHPRFLALLDEMRRTHAAKGSDYSDPKDILSNLRSCEAFGVKAWLGALFRMMDKVERLKQLARKEAQGEGPAVKGEAFEDTLLDLASYALLVRVLREELRSGSR